MTLRIQSNVTSLKGSNKETGNKNLAKNFQRLLEGSNAVGTVNDSAADELIELLEAQIPGLIAARDNANDAITQVRIADDTACEMQGLLARMRSLAERAGRTERECDREVANQRFIELRNSLDRVAEEAIYDEKGLLAGDETSSHFRVGLTTAEMTVPFGGITADRLGVSESNLVSAQDAKDASAALATALEKLADRRVEYESSLNQLRQSYAYAEVVRANMEAAASRFSDIDVAAETVALVRNQIINQRPDSSSAALTAAQAMGLLG